MTDRNHADLRQGIVDTCREMNRNGLNQGTSGNLSHRIPGGMLITPTSLPYERMQPEDIVAMDFAANYQGNHRPSSEWRFHRDILRAREDVNVVLHTHSPFTSVASPASTIWSQLQVATMSVVRHMLVSARRRCQTTPSGHSKIATPA